MIPLRKYILKRLLISVVTIWLIVTACFFLLRLLPGNPFASTTLMTQDTLDRMMAYYGLDRPLWEQYVTYLKNLLHGDFGYSLKYAGRSVNYVIATTFPISAQLGLQALTFGIPMGLLLGIIAAKRRGHASDRAINVFIIVCTAVPTFIIAALLQYLLSVKLGLLPVAQWKSFKHTILPTLCLSLGTVSGYARSMRTLMLEVDRQDYLKTAKAKGLGNVRIVVFHQIRNAIIPMITGIGTEIAGMLMGSYVIEKIFSIPGMGAYFVTSIQGLDYTMVMGLVIFQAVIVVAANFIVDLLYGVVDPRIRVA
ncbi:MAG: ABC transporter permease [Oscillospiraceae bacterium]|nr:ABC transporter permease [Oscillospiraceae bacterium]